MISWAELFDQKEFAPALMPLVFFSDSTYFLASATGTALGYSAALRRIVCYFQV